MGLSRRKFTREFKMAAMRRLEAGVSIAEVARALEVNPNVLHRWRREFRQAPGNAFPGYGQRRWSEPGRRVGAEDRPAGVGDRFFERVLAAHRRTADAAGIDWKSAVYRQVRRRNERQRGLTIERMVELARVSRSRLLPFRSRRASRPIAIWICGMRSSASRWSGRAMGGRGSPPSCGAAAGR